MWMLLVVVIKYEGSKPYATQIEHTPFMRKEECESAKLQLSNYKNVRTSCTQIQKL